MVCNETPIGRQSQLREPMPASDGVRGPLQTALEQLQRLIERGTKHRPGKQPEHQRIGGALEELVVLNCTANCSRSPRPMDLRPQLVHSTLRTTTVLPIR